MKKIINTFVLLAFITTAYTQIIPFNRMVHSYPGTLAITSIIKFQDHYYCMIINVDTPHTHTAPYGILKLDNTFTIVDSNLIDIGIHVIQSPYGLGFDVNPYDSSFILQDQFIQTLDHN